MKLKQSLQRYLYDMILPTEIFMGVMVLVVAIFGTLFRVLDPEDATFSAGNSIFIFIFVLSLSCFKMQIKTGLQNGISRKTSFFTLAVGNLALAAFLAIFDLLFTTLSNLYVPYQSFFQTAYGALGQTWSIWVALLWTFAANAFAGMLGLMLSALYSRMSKALTLIFSIGLPALLVIVLPLADMAFPNLSILSTIFEKISWLWGFGDVVAGVGTSVYPMIAVANCLVCTTLFAGLSYLLVRRVTYKK